MHAYGKVYYVSNSGNNTNPGTLASPYKTIQKGVDMAMAGDTVFVRAGTYTNQKFNANNSGTANAPILISGYANERPIMEGNDTYPTQWDAFCWLKGDYIILRQFEFSHSAGRGIAIYPSATHNQYVTVDDVWIHHTVQAGVYMENSQHFTIKNSKVWQTVRVNDTADVWYQPNMWDAAIMGRDTHGTNGDGKDMKIQNCLIYESFGEGINIHGGMDSVLIEDNIMYNTWSCTIYPLNSTHVTVQRNLVYQTDDVRFQRSKGNASGAIVLSDESRPGLASDITVINNMVMGNYQNFAWWNQGYKATSGLINVLIANNTFVDAHAKTSGQWGNANVFIDNSSYHSNVKFYNNIILQDDPSQPMMNVANNSNISYKNNLYSKTPQAWANSGAVVGDPKLDKTGTFAAGQLTADYFKLQSSSPAIDKALVVAAVPSDYFLTARGSSPDIGAHECTTCVVTTISEKSASGKAVLYPNPAENELTILNIPGNHLKGIKVFNALGQECAVPVNGSIGGVTSLSTAALMPGVYMLQLVTTEGTSVHKFIRK